MNRRRPVAFTLWTLVAGFVLLEIVLRIGAMVVAPDRPQDVESNPDAYRLLAVGDSWVYGAEAPVGEGFVDLVAERLPGVLGRPVQVVNRGRNGGNSAHAVHSALDALPIIEPHAVVVLVGLNNGHNLQGVAELEQRLGGIEERPRFALRSVKALKILGTNLGAGSGPRASDLPSIPPMEFLDDGRCVHANFAFGAAADLDAAALCRGTPRVQAPLLDSAAGRGYLERFVDEEPPPGDDSRDDLSFKILYAAARGDADDVRGDVQALDEGLGVVQGERDVRARYALLRHARETQDWKAVRRHGGALDAWPGRGLLRDLGAAEARILAGDWPTARALLISAHHRAPGFPDVVDVAARFPEPGRDGRVHDAIEWPWPRRSLEREVVRLHSGPGLYHSPQWADPLERAVAAGAPGPSPTTDAPVEVWRQHLAGHAGRGGRESVLLAVQRFLGSDSVGDVVALRYAVRAMVSVGGCEVLLDVADRWYRRRGDAHGWVRAVSQCLDPAAAAERLRPLRREWGPLGDVADWDALVASDHRDFALLERHLDAIVQAAGPGVRVLVLTYPNPTGSFGAHRDAVVQYAATRPVELVDLYALFDERFSDREWAGLLASGGHCNAAGYRVMADEVVRRLRTPL